MPALAPDRIATLLAPYLQACPVPLPPTLFPALGEFLDLLLKWNARTNLTAIRDPESIVTRHFGESLFLAGHLPTATQTLLDLGSGAGFPGIPTQLLRPDLAVTLAESQHKKSAFLREAIRTLALPTLVHAGRAEDLVGQQQFDVVALRAVDNMALASSLASTLGRAVYTLTTAREVSTHPVNRQIQVPGRQDGILLLQP